MYRFLKKSNVTLAVGVFFDNFICCSNTPLYSVTSLYPIAGNPCGYWTPWLSPYCEGINSLVAQRWSTLMFTVKYQSLTLHSPKDMG